MVDGIPYEQRRLLGIGNVHPLQHLFAKIITMADAKIDATG